MNNHDSKAVLLVLRNANIYAPEKKGIKDLVICGKKIVAILPQGAQILGLEIQEVDLQGKTVCPGFVDNHVHILGGGGGLGLSSRAPEIQASQLLRNGITTVIGMLGFDATTKNMAALLAKTKSLKEDGLSAYCLTGATLEHPVPTLTGKIRTDVTFIDEIIGVGELSISELGYGYDSFGKGAQYVAEAAVAGLLAGRLSRKAGYCCLQVPPYRTEILKPIFDVIDKTGIPISQFIPSHVNQTQGYLEDAIKWGCQGGWVDIGANYSPDNNYSRSIHPEKAFHFLLEQKVPLSKILLSSDGNGAPPKEEKGENKPKVANYMSMSALFSTFKKIAQSGAFQLEEVLPIITSNPAEATGLRGKGKIAVGKDADLLVLDEELNVEHVIALGKVVVQNKRPILRSMFEEVMLKELA